MRILFVIDSLGPGGAERSTVALLPLLRAHGHDVAVATLYETALGDEQRLRAAGFDVQPLAGRSFVARVSGLRHRIASLRPDIVHTALFAADMVGRVAAWRSGSIVISSLVNTPYDGHRLRALGRQRWKVRVVQIVDAVTSHLLVNHLHAVSLGVARSNGYALRLPATKVTVVHRGRDPVALGEWSPARRDATRRRLNVPPGSPVILAVGRQEHQKNHVDLIRAVDRLVEELPNIVLLIAGRPGNATAALEECLVRHPRAASVARLLGHRSDVPDLLCAADVLVIPSIYEGTAGAAIEAMGLLCPVVCADVPGVVGILEDGFNALLVRPGDPAALAGAVGRVLSDAMLADSLRDQGRRDFLSRFTIDVAAAEMERLYTGLLSDS